ncbi:ribosome maturation factor RimM [Olsenella massiliensis]|uniref:ribosome maturation factor RimM n=1 Tax=Olsenella massiliensis TaxID=1622075 RepID=UPI00071CA5AC|nr:hypothetical protein [Olsenella massiliensis]
MRQSFRQLARVEKAHGRRGEVVAVPVDGLPCYLRPGMTVWAVPPPLKAPRRLMIQGLRGDGEGRLVSFEGVGDIDAASAYVGTTLLAATDDLPADFWLHDARTLVGRPVRDLRRGDVGSIVEVMRGVANDGWVVRGPDGDLLVAVVDEQVVGIDEGGVVVVRLPADARAATPGEDEEVSGS